MNNLTLSLTQSLIPIILVMLAITALSVFVYLRTPDGFFIKFFIIPISLFGMIFVPTTFTNLLGYAYPHTLPEKFIYLGHKVVVKDHKKVNIEVWTGHPKDGSTRLYLIPYEKLAEKQLNQARDDTGQGKRVEMSLKGTSRGGLGGGGDEYPYSTESKSPSDLMPKGGGAEDQGDSNESTVNTPKQVTS